MADRGKHTFGGSWTDSKLEVLRKYLAAYTQALKNTPFKTAYIDAFAGTGYRTPAKAGGELPLFPDFDEPEELFLDGSAKIALEIEPRFTKYIFIERSKKKCDALEQLAEQFPTKKPDIDIRKGDANEVMRKLCSSTQAWASRRAVLFLDPYGCEVEWTTIEAIAKTKAIDLWLLFPLGIGVNRLLTNSGDIPESWGKRLDLLLGSKEWRDKLYTMRPAPNVDLFSDAPQLERVKANLDEIGLYFVDRLRTVFPGVAPNPLTLMNSTGNPLYLFCFAASAPGKGSALAVKLATEILKKFAADQRSPKGPEGRPRS